MAPVLLKVPIEDGSQEFVEVEIDRRQVGEAVELVSADDKGYTAARSLGASFGRLLPAVSAILTRLRAHEHAPDEITMEMGVTVGGETGLIFTKGTAEATFTVTVGWRRPSTQP